MKTVYVIDTSSLINFFRYYQFDNSDGGAIYKKLSQFLIDKINSGEIIMIDKVFEELKIWREFESFKEDIKDKLARTETLIVEVKKLSNKYYRPENEKLKNNDSNIINQEITDHENTHADLFLVAKCNSVKNNETKPVLVTDETKRDDGKLFHKIPTMCQHEKIMCITLPQLLFGEYKKELIFELKIKAP